MDSKVTTTDVDVTIRIDRPNMSVDEVKHLARTAIRKQFSKDSLILGDVEVEIISVEREQ
jgi:20S proteasome alpha/beta subunit